MNKLTKFLIALIIFLLGAVIFSVTTRAQVVDSGTPLVLGEDDEDEEDEEDEDEDEDEDDNSAKAEKKTVTTYTKLPDQIIKRLITETIYDSDGDGVFDPDDSTPNLHNIFLVKDDNFNGIADQYEGK